MFHLFQQVTTYKPLVPRLFQEQGTKTGTFQEQHWNAENMPLTSRNVWNMFQGDYFSSRKTKGTIMTAQNPNRVRVDGLEHTPILSMLIRKDLRTPGRIYFEGPKIASLTPEQAIAVANRIADVLDGDTE